MASQANKQLHFVLFPLMAPGHMNPMTDLARLLAQHGVIVTLVTTPGNASRIESILLRAVLSGLQIRLVLLEFPAKEVPGLPVGCENFDMLPSQDMALDLFIAMIMLQKPAEKLFETLTPRPSCIISDLYIPWTAELAENYGIPRIGFHGYSCFSHYCELKVRTTKVAESMTSESEYFIVPGIPDKIQITKAHVPNLITQGYYTDIVAQMLAAEMRSYGFILNTFEELEQEYVQDYKKEKMDKVWCIGPVSLCNKDDLDKAQRGNKSSMNEHKLLEWLDLQQPKSVVYACLGSLCHLIPSQLIEIALALEASNRLFIWALRGGNRFQELEKWIIKDGFEERIKGRGFLIPGWAPQVLILSHPAIGGFLTHCGWNSSLEGISAGLPLITWPLFGDQFLNEKLVVQVLRIGVSVGVQVPLMWGEEEKTGVLVKKEDINKAICMVMDEGEDGEERRKRAKDLGEMAKRAVEEGGSSHLNISLLIQEIMQLEYKENKLK